MKPSPPPALLELLPSLAPMQRAALGVVRRLGSCSRQELGEYFQLPPPAISKIMKPLLDQALLQPESVARLSPGRPRSVLQLHPGALCAFGVSLGFTSFTLALVDLGGHLLGPAVTQSILGLEPPAIIERIAGECRQMRAQHPDRAPVGLGVAFAGVTRGANDLTRAFPETAPWQHVPFADLFAAHDALPLVVQNDTFAGLLGELRYGSAVRKRDVLFLYLDEGINLGVLSNGRVHQGHNRVCGEFGHIKVLPDGPFCHCGDVGCLESVASSWAIIRELRQRIGQGVHAGTEGFTTGEPISLELISRAARDGVLVARNLLGRSGELIGGLLATVANIFDPECVLVGGRYGGEADHAHLIQAIREAFTAQLHHSRTVPIPLESSALGAAGSLIGAAALVFEHHLPAYPVQFECQQAESHTPGPDPLPPGLVRSHV